MSEAFNENLKHDYQVMRTNAFLISVFGGLDAKVRKKLSPEKMLPMNEARTEISEDEKRKLRRLMRKMSENAGRFIS